MPCTDREYASVALSEAYSNRNTLENLSRMVELLCRQMEDCRRRLSAIETRLKL
jgi:hypothetical protein